MFEGAPVGALRPGVLVDGGGAPAGKLPFTLLQALDVPVADLGAGEGFVDQPLAELLV